MKKPDMIDVALALAVKQGRIKRLRDGRYVLVSKPGK